MVTTRSDLNTKFVRVYWENRLKQIDCADVFAALSLIEEAYNLGRDDLSYEMLGVSMTDRLSELYITVTQEIVDFLRLDPDKDYNFVFNYVVAFLGIILTVIARKHG